MTMAVMAVDLNEALKRILEGIHLQSYESFQGPDGIVHYSRSKDDRFLEWEFPEALLLSYRFVPAQVLEFTASILQIPAGIRQNCWRYKDKDVCYFILGHAQNFSDATKARVSTGGGLYPIHSGEPVIVPRDMNHTFDVAEEGSLFVLAVRNR